MHAPGEMLNGGAAPTDDNSPLIELAILEYFLDQSIVLRLENLYPADPFLGADERALRLQHALHYSQTIQRTRRSPRPPSPNHVQ